MKMVSHKQGYIYSTAVSAATIAAAAIAAAPAGFSFSLIFYWKVSSHNTWLHTHSIPPPQQQHIHPEKS